MNGIRICLTMGARSEWLPLPATREEAGAVLEKIGGPGGAFRAFRITACEAGFDGKLDDLIVGADLDTVNYLAARLAGLSTAHIELLDAMLESPLRQEVLLTIARVIDFTYNTDRYELYFDVAGSEDLAQYYIHHSGQIQMPPEWAEGIDLVRFGKHLEQHEPGYYTRCGYLIATGLDWKPVFEARGEVPPEYRIAP